MQSRPPAAMPTAAAPTAAVPEPVCVRDCCAWHTGAVCVLSQNSSCCAGARKPKGGTPQRSSVKPPAAGNRSGVALRCLSGAWPEQGAWCRVSSNRSGHGAGSKKAKHETLPAHASAAAVSGGDIQQKRITPRPQPVTEQPKGKRKKHKAANADNLDRVLSNRAAALFGSKSLQLDSKWFD